MAEENEERAQEAFQASRHERDRTIEAIREFETALGRAAGSSEWLGEVKSDLQALESVMSDEQHELNRPDALLAMISSENPRRFGSRIRNLREQYSDIIRQVGSLRRQLEESADEELDATDLRQRGRWIVSAIHNCRARQTDLVYEALRLDLGER